MKHNNSPKCAQCGSHLVLISEKKEKLEGALFPSTISTYRCSNDKCQKEIDKQTAKRKKLQKEKAIMDKKREEIKLENKRLKTKNRLEAKKIKLIK